MNKEKPSEVDFMSRHFVALLCHYDAPMKDGKTFHGSCLTSGFVLEMHGHWFWVTAGHCLRDELDTNITSNKIKLTGGGFVDYFGWKATNNLVYPFTYEVGLAFAVDDPSVGYDFSLLYLSPLIVQNFLANGVVPISRANWEFQGGMEFMFYKMLGVPRPDDSLIEDDTISVQPKLLHIEKMAHGDLGPPPPGAAAPSPDWFVGRIHPDIPEIDITGMSGGPIYGFRRNPSGDLTYHVVAIQSRWWDRQRIVFGCQMTGFAERAYQEFKRVLCKN